MSKHHKLKTNRRHGRRCYCFRISFSETQFAEGVPEHGAKGKRDSYSCEQKQFIVRNVMISSAHQTYFGSWNQGGWNGLGMWHVCRRREMHLGFAGVGVGVRNIWRRGPLWTPQARLFETNKPPLWANQITRQPVCSNVTIRCGDIIGER